MLVGCWRVAGGRLETGAFFDASKLRGLGWALFQWEKPPNKGIRLIKCGSRSLIPAMKNYSVGEIETCAIFFGLRDLDFYLRGLKFRGLTDHRPLVGIFKKPLDLIESPRIACMVEKLQM